MIKVSFLTISLLIGCGVACYYMAKDKGLKNPIIWGIAGIFGSVLTILLISFLRNKVLGKKMGNAQYFEHEDPD